jgi:AbrB family looped-hinge helix DNA binding protein
MPVKISNKGWIVIPAELRKKYNLKPGDRVEVVDYGGVLSIVPKVKDPITYGYGMLKGGRSLTKALVEDRAKERARER